LKRGQTEAFLWERDLLRKEGKKFGLAGRMVRCGRQGHFTYHGIMTQRKKLEGGGRSLPSPGWSCSRARKDRFEAETKERRLDREENVTLMETGMGVERRFLLFCIAGGKTNSVVGKEQIRT